MKLFLVLLTMTSLRAFAAQGECASVWIYRDCAPTPTPDLTKPGIDSYHMTTFSDFVKPMDNGQKLCHEMRDDFNTGHAPQGLYAEVTIKQNPIGDMVGVQEHKVECDLTVTRYPLLRACEGNDKFQQKVGGDASGLPADATCLSCDNLNAAKLEVIAQCLRENILNVIQTHATPLHSADYLAVARQVDRVLKSPLQNLRTPEQLAPLEEFLRENPVSQNQNSSSGGLGSRPTQQ